MALMNINRYIIRFKAPADRPDLSDWEGRFHCAGLPNDPHDIENAMLMSEKAVKAVVKTHRFPNLPFDVIPVICTLEL